MSLKRWKDHEVQGLADLRAALGDVLTSRKQYPDVVGDRRLLKFLRGHNFNIEKVTQLVTNFLKWRDDNKVDNVRDDILYGNIKTPHDFPHGQKILKHMHQILIAHDATTVQGHPICFEEFNFRPDEFMKEVTREEYIEFMTYCLEYKTLILEQMSNLKEQENIKNYDKDPNIRENGYGVILACCIIRDFAGYGMAQMSGDGQVIVKWIFELAATNYPELLYKSYMVNTPWLFNTLWYFLKNLLDPRTIAKISISGSDFLSLLTKEIPIENIPAKVGGKYADGMKPFKFDLSKEGPFYYPGGPSVDPEPAVDSSEHLDEYPVVESYDEEFHNVDMGVTATQTAQGGNLAADKKDKKHKWFHWPKFLKRKSATETSVEHSTQTEGDPRANKEPSHNNNNNNNNNGPMSPQGKTPTITPVTSPTRTPVKSPVRSPRKPNDQSSTPNASGNDSTPNKDGSSANDSAENSELAPRPGESIKQYKRRIQQSQFTVEKVCDIKEWKCL